MVGVGSAHIGLQWKPSDAIERFTLARQRKGLDGLAAEATGHKEVESQVIACKGTYYGTSELSDSNGYEWVSELISPAERLTAHFFVLATGHQMEREFIHGCQNVRASI